MHAWKIVVATLCCQLVRPMSSSHRHRPGRVITLLVQPSLPIMSTFSSRQLARGLPHRHIDLLQELWLATSSSPGYITLKIYFTWINSAEILLLLSFLACTTSCVRVINFGYSTWCRSKLCRYFPEEEGMMQHSGGRYFPQIWNQGYRTSRTTKQHIVNSPRTQITTTRNPTC